MAALDRENFVARIQDAAANGRLQIVDHEGKLEAGNATALAGAHLPEHWLDPATLWFEQEIDPASLTNDAVKIVDRSTGSPVDVRLGLAGGHVVTMQPVDPFVNKGDYDFVVSNGLRDVIGRPVTATSIRAMVK